MLPGFMRLCCEGVVSKASDKTKKKGEKDRIVAIKKIRMVGEQTGCLYTTLALLVVNVLFSTYY